MTTLFNFTSLLRCYFSGGWGLQVCQNWRSSYTSNSKRLLIPCTHSPKVGFETLISYGFYSWTLLLK